MAMPKTSKPTTSEISESVAFKSNYNQVGSNDLYAFCRKLYRRTDDGRLYFCEFGGAAISVDTTHHYVDRAEAVDWVATEASDPITGYGYTRAQAEIMVDGGDAGKGYREVD